MRREGLLSGRVSVAQGSGKDGALLPTTQGATHMPPSQTPEVTAHGLQSMWK